MPIVNRFLTSSLAGGEAVCHRCRLRLLRSLVRSQSFSNSTLRKDSIRSIVKPVKTWRREYFSANTTLRSLQDTVPIRAGADEPTFPSTTPSSSFETSEPPHRRRKRLKASEATANDSSTPSTSSTSQFLPSNSSSTFSTISSQLPQASIRRLLTTCLALSKPRLSFLIVLTTAASYSLYPVSVIPLPEAVASPSLSALTLLYLTTGTGLCAASANAMNMLLEPEHDAQMSRTRNRPIVRGLIGKRGALIFAVVAGTLGVGGLYFGINPTVAFLGGANIVLYAGVYTPMKRLSVLNTWVGALVGGIPPLMGWAAAAEQSTVGDGSWRDLLFNDESVGGWLLAGLLFAWQFPHFNSLSWPIREEYKNAGYRMLVWTNAKLNGRVALRYAVLCFPICVGLYWYGITDQGFLITSSVVNGWMVQAAWRFWRLEGHKGSARGLFWASVWHLPLVMALAMLHKQGMWESVWKRVSNEDEQGARMPLENGEESIVVYGKPTDNVGQAA